MILPRRLVPHARYLKYVLLHKLYVFRAGCVIGGYSPRWLWRLLVHDRSKFSRAEWGPYVCQFYGEPVEVQAEREIMAHEAKFPHERLTATGAHEVIRLRTASLSAQRKRAFDAAWLHHIHANPHHWQHWVLLEDSGVTKVLVPPGDVVCEMVADWLGAGQKVLRRPTLRECVGETIVWYVTNAGKMQLRAPVRTHVETMLMRLAHYYKLDKLVGSIETAAQQRATIAVTTHPARY